MATDVGKVGFRVRGDWSSASTYEVMDVVSYNNGLYVAKQNVPANTAPTNTTYWQTAVDGSTFYNITNETSKITYAEGVSSTTGRTRVYKFGKLVVMQLQLSCTVSTTNGMTIFTVDDSLKPVTMVVSSVVIQSTSNGAIYGFGNIWIPADSNEFKVALKNIDSNGNAFVGTVVYFTA